MLGVIIGLFILYTKCYIHFFLYSYTDDSHCSTLLNLLKDIENWEALGRNLGVADNYIQGLVALNPTVEEAMRGILTVWISQGEASRMLLIDALIKIGENDTIKSL